MNKQVVVTGIGLVTPIGRGKDEFWENCLNGLSGISPIEDSFFSTNKELVGGQIKQFKISDYYPNSEAENLGRGSQFLYDCLTQSVTDSGICHDQIDQIFIGTTMGESSNVETIDNYFKGKRTDQNLKRKNHQENLIKDALSLININNIEASLICNACSGGNYAIVTGYESIKNGDADVVAVGGIDPFSSITLLGFHRLGALAKESCKPFSENRDGMLVSEGGCVLILEEKQHAQRRKANIIAEVIGYGLTSDAYHINAPHPNGNGITRAIKQAFKSSKIDNKRVGYISLHGTGTRKNDEIEARVIQELFSDSQPCSSIKSMLGHSMGAASAIEAASCCFALRDGFLPPTINYTYTDDKCRINCIPNKKIKKSISFALNLSAGFGGTNAAVMFKKYTG